MQVLRKLVFNSCLMQTEQFSTTSVRKQVVCPCDDDVCFVLDQQD